MRLDFRQAPSYTAYGFQTSLAGEPVEGTPIEWRIFLDTGAISIENYYIDVPTHDDALLSAGFREIRWHLPQLDPEGVREFGADYWATFLECPPIAFIECIK